MSKYPNEKALLSYYAHHIIGNSTGNGTNVGRYEIQRVSANSHCLFVFSLEHCMHKIHGNLGWQSSNEILRKICKKISDYCQWFAKDYGIDFKIFHPSFNSAEFIVLAVNMSSSNCRSMEKCHLIAEDFSDCILTDIARSVKYFFEQLQLYVGYAMVTDDEQLPPMEVLYFRAKSAVARGKKYSRFSENPRFVFVCI